MEYKCERCGFTTKNKGDLKRHLQRKKECPATLSNASTHELFEELLQDDDDRKYECQNCGRKFKSSQTKYIHRKKHCKVVNDDVANAQEVDKKNDVSDDIEEMKKRIAFLEQMYEKRSVVQHNTNNGVINNNNNHYHITIRNFGTENMDALPHHLIRNCFMNLEFDTIFQNLHFDPRES